MKIRLTTERAGYPQVYDVQAIPHIGDYVAIFSGPDAQVMKVVHLIPNDSSEVTAEITVNYV